MRTFLVLFSLLLAGCASPSINVTEFSVVDEKVGKAPTIGIQATAPVGGVMYKQFKYWSKTGYRIQKPFSIGLGFGKIAVSEGDFVAKANLHGESVYCAEKLAYIDPLAGPFGAACFIDADNDGRFEAVKAAHGVYWFKKNISPPLAYEKSEHIIPRTDSFKYELLYQGVSNKSLRLFYREYLNDFARPAFFQDVSYDFTAKPTTVTFRTVKIEVINADNIQIVYRVLSGF